MKSWVDNSYRLKWILTVTVITAGVYLGFRFLLPLIFPFIVAYFLAWIVRPITEFFYRRLKIPRIIGGSFSLLVLLTVLGAGICFLVNILIKQAFAFIRNIPVYLDAAAGRMESLCKYCDKYMGLNHGTMRSLLDENITKTVDKVKSNLMPQLTERSISMTIKMIGFIGIVLIVFVAAVLIVKDLPGFHDRYSKNEIYRDIHKVTVKLSEAGVAYLRTQLIIMSIVAVIGVIGLSIMKSDYAVLLGVGIAIMDALPILGSGIVYIPWAIIMLISGKIYPAAILITTYLICQIIREVLEPKLIGNRIGIKPLFTLVAMYIGVKLFSIAGFILGPIGLVIIITTYKAVNEKSQTVANKDNISYNED